VAYFWEHSVPIFAITRTVRFNNVCNMFCCVVSLDYISVISFDVIRYFSVLMYRYPFYLLPLPRRLCFCCCLLATLHKNLQTDLHEIFREG